MFVLLGWKSSGMSRICGGWAANSDLWMVLGRRSFCSLKKPFAT